MDDEWGTRRLGVTALRAEGARWRGWGVRPMKLGHLLEGVGAWPLGCRSIEAVAYIVSLSPTKILSKIMTTITCPTFV